MNLIDFTVIDVLCEPEHHKFPLGECWTVEVIATAYGRESKTQVFCKTLEEACKVKTGYVFQG